MTTKLVIVQALAAAVSFFIVSVSLLSTWALYFEAPYLTYQNIPFPRSTTDIIQPGGTVGTEITRCNSSNQSLIYNSTKFLINEETLTVTEFPVLSVFVLPGCKTSNFSGTRLPLDIPPGIYHFYGVSTVSGGYISHAVPWYSQSFPVGKLQK